MSYLQDIYRYRGFVAGSVEREFSSRYRNSMLGAAWLILQPLAQILVYTLIFSNVMKARLPGVGSAFGYSIFLCAGILTWALFSEMVGKSQTMFLDNANLIKKLSFPRIILPAIVTINACLGFAIIFAMFLAFLLLTGNFPGWPVLGVPVLLAIQIVFALGVGMVVGVLNVFFRDVGQLFGIALQFWFWLTPIVYPVSALPAWAHDILAINPMTAVITGYQTIFVQQAWPDWRSAAFALGLGILLCLLGFRLFRAHSGEMVDEL